MIDIDFRIEGSKVDVMDFHNHAEEGYSTHVKNGQLVYIYTECPDFTGCVGHYDFSITRSGKT